MVPIPFTLQVPGPVCRCLAADSCPPTFPAPGPMALDWGHGGEVGIIQSFFFFFFPILFSYFHLKDLEEQYPRASPALSPHIYSMKKGTPKARCPRLSLPLWSNVLPHSGLTSPQLIAGVFLSDPGTATLIQSWWSSRETKAPRQFRMEPSPIPSLLFSAPSHTVGVTAGL